MILMIATSRKIDNMSLINAVCAPCYRMWGTSTAFYEASPGPLPHQGILVGGNIDRIICGCAPSWGELATVAGSLPLH